MQAFREGDDPAEKARVEARLTEVQGKIARKQLEDGKRFLKAEQFDAAFRCFEVAEELSKGVDEAVFAEADRLLTAMEAGEIGEEEEEEDEEEDEDGPAARFELLIQTFEPARIEAYQALGAAFRDAYLLLNEGEAAAALEGLEGLEDSSGWLAFERGRALLLSGDAAAAVEHLKASVEAVPEALSSPPVTQLVQAALRADDVETAAAAADRFAEQEGENSADALIVQLSVMRFREDFDAAEAKARAWLKKRPSQLRVWRYLGGLLEAAKKPVAAIGAYEQVMSLRWRFNPDEGHVELDVQSAVRLTELLVTRGENLERAHQLLNALMMLVPGDQQLPLVLLRAGAYRQEGKATEAEAAAAEAMDMVSEEDAELFATVKAALEAQMSEAKA